MDTLARANEALQFNPPPYGVQETLSLNGSDWLWAVTGIYIFAFLGLLVFCFSLPESNRMFCYLFTCSLLVGSVTYYAQASDLGWTVVQQANELDRSGVSRQIFWAKYVNWVVSFPSAALALGLLAGVSWTTIFTNLFISWLWVLTYLAAAFTATDYKWGFFAFGTFGYVILAMSTLNESREAAQRLGIGRDYVLLSVWANILWLLYPIAFALSDGGNYIGVAGSFVFFGVLDILFIPVLSFAYLALGRRWDWQKLHLDLSEHRFAPPLAS
ncbi:hypothetical protein F4778DRAFT_743844 [Xylariomycetidae sp. FL2044]|nr:hypothetical protein F4778DRAFT_743844 [Xylariomycetidae sp. FL2044]